MPERLRVPLNLDRIYDLADQMEGPAEALKFLETYFAMLPGRLERILTALHAHDGKASADASLSLKISSSMTGALSTEACCLELEMHVRGERFDRAMISSRRLVSEVSALCAYTPDLIAEARRAFTDAEGMAA